MWQRGNEIIFQMENTQMGKMPSLFSSFFFPFICLNCVNYAWEIFQTAAFLLTSVCRAVWWIVCSLSQCYLPPIPTAGKKKKKKERVGRVWLEVVSFICHPGLFDLPPYGTLLNEDESCINTGGHREMPSRTQIHARKVKKKIASETKSKQALETVETQTPQEHTSIHPSVYWEHILEVCK